MESFAEFFELQLLISRPVSPNGPAFQEQLMDFLGPKSPTDFRQHIIRRALARRINKTRLFCKVSDSVLRSLDSEIKDLHGQIELLKLERRQRNLKLRKGLFQPLREAEPV
jgi:hypothetical protein